MSRQWRSDDTSTWSYGFGNGSDGNLTISSNTTDSPIDSSCSGTSGATSLSATNASFAAGQFILIHQSRGTGAGNWELNRISSYTAGTITTTLALQNTYTDSGASQAQVLVLKQYNNVTVNSGVTLTAKAWDGNVGGIVAFFAKGTTTVTGTISAAGTSGVDNSGLSNAYQAGSTGGGFRGGSGHDKEGGSLVEGFSGEGTSGAQAVQTSANGNGGGGATFNNGTLSRSAGGGSNGTAGNDGTVASPGSTSGNAGLTSMVFGGGGGGGGRGESVGNGAAGGASGGGIVLIFSATTTITGSINVGGGNAGVNGNTSGQAAEGGASSSGAGAGGSILFKSINATLGSLLVLAQGGSGTAATGGKNGAGGNGRIHIDYSGSLSGTTSPTIDSRTDSTIVQATTRSTQGILLVF